MKKEKRFTVLVGCDVHIPFQDNEAVDVWFKFLAYLKPDVVVLHEIMDFYPLSRFDKDPKRALTLQEDLDATYKFLKRVRKVSGKKARLIMLESNHDFRLQKYLSTKAPELSYLRSLQLSSLLRLKELKIESREEVMIRGVLFKHGSVVRSKSGYTATSEMERTGCSGLAGHVHRCAQVYKRLQGGFYTWLECGCLCDINPEYVNHPDWQQGCGVVQFVGQSKRFYATVVPIIKHQILWGKRTFSARK